MGKFQKFIFFIQDFFREKRNRVDHLEQIKMTVTYFPPLLKDIF